MATDGPKGFEFLTGDCNWSDYGGKWYRRIGNTTRFWVIDWTLDPEHEDDNARYPVGWLDLSEVDLAMDADTLDSACQYYGGRFVDGVALDQDGEPMPDLMLVEALHAYGSKAPIEDRYGGAVKRFMRELSALARKLERDNDAYENAMDKPVNAIGATAREFQRGELMGPVLRGVAEGNNNAEILLKAYTNCGGQTLGGKPWK